MEVCDITKPVYFQWAAGIPNLASYIPALRIKCPPEPTVIKGSCFANYL